MRLLKLCFIISAAVIYPLIFQSSHSFGQDSCEDCDKCREAHTDKEHPPWPFQFHYHGSEVFSYVRSTGPGYEVPKAIKVRKSEIEIMPGSAWENPSCTKHSEVTVNYTVETLKSGSVEISRTNSEGDSSSSTDNIEANLNSELAGKVWSVVDAKVNTGLTIGDIDSVENTTSNEVGLKNSWTEELKLTESQTEKFFIDPDTKVSRYRKYQFLYTAKVTAEFWEDEIVCKPLAGFPADPVYTRCGTGHVTVEAKRKSDVKTDQIVQPLGNCTPAGGRIRHGVKTPQCLGGRWTESIDGELLKDDDLCQGNASSGTDSNPPSSDEGTGDSVLEDPTGF